MTPSAADDGSSPTLTVTEGETREEAVEAAPVAAVEEGVEAKAMELEEGAEEGEGMAKDTAKGLVKGSAVDDMNEIPKEKPGGFGGNGKHGDNSKDKVADISSNDGDAGGSGCGVVQDGELAGDLEIFVDELPKDCVEEDFAMVFSQCGEIKFVRIIKNSSTGKSKDIAFVGYVNIEAAKKALAEFKEGIEVKGKKVRVSACQDNNTLYLGNICKSWTKDQVLNTLKSIGIGQLEMNLPTDKKGRSRGFAFLEFASHYYARAAFHRLMRSDAIFGIDRSAKVSFARTPTKSNEEFLTEVTTVYLDHVPLYWDEGKIKECCDGYGKIQNVNLFQISNNTEKNFFSLVEFSSSKSAIACVEGINNAKIGDGGFKLSASLAQPKGGIKVNNGAASEDANTSKKKKDDTEEVVENKSSHKLPKLNKSEVTSRTMGVLVKKSSPNELPKGNESKLASQGATGVLQTSNPSKGKRTVGKNINTSVNQRSLKKARSKRSVNESRLSYQGAAEVVQTSNSSKGKRKAGKNRNTYINERPSKKAQNNYDAPTRLSNTTQLDGYARGTGQSAGPRYASNSQAYPSVRATSRSKAHASDLEPHAGYIPPASRVHSTHASAQYNIHQTDVLPYATETTAPHPIYSDYTSHAGYQAGYAYVYPPPPPPSGSCYQGSGPYIPRRRGDY